MAVRPSLVFVAAYQVRSSRRSLQPFLDMFCLQAEVVPRRSFLHQLPRAEAAAARGEDEGSGSDDCAEASDADNGGSGDEAEGGEDIPSVEELFVIVIRRL